MARDHGFSVGEVDRVVRPVVSGTPFRKLEMTRTGSMIRMEMEKSLR
jgi:hypothetical protein